MIQHAPATVSFLDRLLEPVAECLSADAAQALIDLRADAATQARLDELAEKAGEGELTEDDRREYETFVVAMNLVGVLQAKARRLLRDQVTSTGR